MEPGLRSSLRSRRGIPRSASTDISRKEFIEAGKNSDAVLSFEAGITEQGKDYASTARRGATAWELHVHAKAGHSGGIFSASAGDGAIFEVSRILNLFHDTLREPNMTYSAGLLLGGSNIKVEASGDASVAGKVNIIPGEALAMGDLRVLTPDQLARVKNKMQSIVAAGTFPAPKRRSHSPIIIRRWLPRLATSHSWRS